MSNSDVVRIRQVIPLGGLDLVDRRYSPEYSGIGLRQTQKESLPALLDRVYEYSTDFVRRGESRAPADFESLNHSFAHPLQEEGADAIDVLDELIRNGERGLLHSGASTFLGYVMGGAHPVATATELLTTVWDQCAALYATSPTASVVEATVARWLVDLFGLPACTSVGITSGCAMANLTGLAAARHHVLADVGWDVERNGLIGAPPPRILVSEGCHVTVYRALRLLGLAGQITTIGTDNQGRMSMSELGRAAVRGSGPLIVCGQVGNVDTGSVDPLEEVCDISHGLGGWVHLDAAFGMWAATSRTRRRLVRGLERADSWATDAHKWLNVPYDCGVVLCAHPSSHRAAMQTTANYLTGASGGARDAADYTPELSRRARGLVMWSTLRHLGRTGVADLVDRCCELARRLAVSLSVVPGIEVVNDVVLNQVLVQFSPTTELADARSRMDWIVARIQAGRTGWASSTTWRGVPALRLSVCNWQTTAEDIDACVLAITEAYASTSQRTI